MSKVRRNTQSSEEPSSSSATSSSLSSDEEIDARDLKPIKDYLLDRRELACQLFKSVKPEKIRMMLPQALKKMNLDELEEWCASELSGMSKSRILCIINGKAMEQSSDTSESDDSGPSLEIISDTEEWFTDDDMSKLQDGLQSGKVKPKKERVKLKSKSQGHTKDDATANCKNNGNKHLLDLIELEMRARAIRALIRKEEDVKPDVSKCKENMNVLNISNKTNQDELKAKENCRKQLERIITAQHASTVDDEDVVLVVQPTPTIELLSSESDGEAHGGTRINKKLQNERIIETEKGDKRNENGNVKDMKRTNTVEKLKEKNTQETIVKGENTDTVDHEVSVPVHRNNMDNKSKESGETKPSGKRRKVKKKSRSKEQLKNSNVGEGSSKLKTNVVSKETKDIEATEPLTVSSTQTLANNDETNANDCPNLTESKVVKSVPVSEIRNDVKKQIITNSTFVEEEKSNDLDEIIDLDDYCDDMEDMESSETDKRKTKQVKENEQPKPQAEVRTTQKTSEAETWASRYYQTDDVQNVIKESKIQSEIRKRLRERQRLSKLNESISRNSPSSSTTTEVVRSETEQNPTGSVDEYLALKRTATVSLSTNSSDNSTDIVQNKDVPIDTCTHTNTVIVHSHTAVTYSKEKDDDTKTTVNDSNTPDTTLPKKEEAVDGITVNGANSI